MEMPTHKISAIKALRDLPVTFKIVSVETVHYGMKEYQTAVVNLSLLEAKNLVEAIMAINPPPTYEVENLKAEVLKWKDAYRKLREKMNEAFDSTPSLYSLEDNEPSF